MDTESLVSPNARAGSAAAEFNALIGQRAELVKQIANGERAARFGSTGAQEARAALIALERRAAGGEEVSAGERRKGEQRLKEAQAASQEPWGQRIEASRLALRDVDREVGTLITERLDELLSGLDEEAEAVTERASAALAEVVSAYRAREAVAGRIDALAGTIRRPRFGDVTLSKLAPIVREATRVLEGGPPGEVKPRLKADPRQPRGGSLPAAEESPWPPVTFA
jgi:hypothetical protein